MTYLIYFILVFLFFGILLNIFLIIFDNKLKKLENKIILLFEKRTNLVPVLYDISKEYISKHDEVFKQILNLRKIEFSNYQEDFELKIKNEIQIHHELNFVFKVIGKNPRILTNGKYLLIRDLFLENSDKIGEKVELYKMIIRKLNFYLSFKDLSIIGLFIDIKKRNEI